MLDYMLNRIEYEDYQRMVRQHQIVEQVSMANREKARPGRIARWYRRMLTWIGIPKAAAPRQESAISIATSATRGE